MKLSTKSRYGVKAMLDLAIHYGDDPISVKKISQRQNISEHYLEQLFSSLRKSNLIRSIRGSKGGYILNRKPEDILVSEVIEVLEGPIELSDCIENENCNNIDYCATRLLWIKIKDSIDNVTDSITLQDMVDDYNKLKVEGARGNE